MKNFFLVIAIILISHAAFSQLHISSGATLHLSGNARVTLENINLVNDGTISTPGNGRFIFTGTNNNEISGSQMTVFGELEIAKSGSGMLTLQRDISVINKIVFTSNLIELNSHNIDLQNSGILEGENENSRITGISGGEVILSATLNAPTGIDPGNLGAVITSAQNLGTTIIRRGHQPQTNSGGIASSIQRYFDIIPTNNAGLNATFRFNYFDAEKNSLDENIFELWRSDNNINWTEIGFSNRNSTANFVEQNGINDFSRWTLSAAGALPVSGLVLSGKWKKKASYLDWITLSEYHNKGFNIERKYQDDLNFVKIGFLPSAYTDGNAQTKTTYTWKDAANANHGPIQYRIKQEDYDGRIAYSNIIVIKPENSGLFIESLYPNVAVYNQLYIKAGSMDVEKMQVDIFDLNGRKILSKQLQYQSQWLSLPELNSGFYKIFIQEGKNKWTGSFVKK